MKALTPWLAAERWSRCSVQQQRQAAAGNIEEKPNGKPWEACGSGARRLGQVAWVGAKDVVTRGSSLGPLHGHSRNGQSQTEMLRFAAGHRHLSHGTERLTRSSRIQAVFQEQFQGDWL